MANLDVLLDPDFLLRVDFVVQELLGSFTSWALLDARGERATASIVHRRAYLADPPLAPGFRVLHAALADLPRAGCARVLLAPAGESPLALALANDAEATSTPWIALLTSPGGKATHAVDRNGQKIELAAITPRRGAKPLQLSIRSSSTTRTQLMLPRTFCVSSRAPRSLVTVNVDPGAGFEQAAHHFQLVSSYGQPIGTGELHLDVRVSPTRRDELVATATGFASGDVRVEVWEENNLDEEPAFAAGPITLHVLFDRTSLDVDVWTAALEAAPRRSMPSEPAARAGAPLSAGSEMAFSTPAPAADVRGGMRAPDDWNVRLRRALGGALDECAADLHDGVQFDFWWFADFPRDGIAHGTQLPVATAPFGWRGPNRTPSDELLTAHYSYVSGMDFFDAVDEALAAVAEQIAAESPGAPRHAVLIVGDSPPPPEGPHDRMWQELVDRPIRTSARRSTEFARALTRLTDAGIPVGWLFLRADDLPPEARADHRRRFSEYAALNEATFHTLRSILGLRVVGADAQRDLRPRLRELFGLLRRAPPPVDWLQVDTSFARRP